MSKKTVLIALGCVAVATAGGAAWWWAGAGEGAAVVAQARPAQPDLGAVVAPLREKIATADAHARSRWSAPQGLIELSRLYHANGFLDEALRCYEGLARLEPKEARWPHLHATILAGYGDTEPALALWRRAVELAPDYLPARLRLGDGALKANRLDEAAAVYGEVLKRKPDEPYAMLGLARLDLEAERWEQARQRLEAVVSATNYTLGYDLIVSLYERLGQRERAAAIRGSAKASGAYRDPADPWLDELIDVCYDPYRLALAAGFTARNGNPKKGVELLERAIELTPNDVATRFQLGGLQLEQNNVGAAREQFERCTTLDPEFSDGWAQLSGLQTRMGEHAAAERTLAAGLQRNPESPGLHLMRARNLRKSGRPGEAIAAFRTSIRLRPNEPDAYLELGNMFVEMGRTEEGIVELKRALETDPANPMALGILAFYSISTGNETEAQRWMTRVANQPRVGREQRARLLQAYRQQFGREWR